jgi:hypothetical protein
MYNFGKIPPRAIQASGVASVLGEDCRVFYDNLFHSAGLGRVSDLLSGRLRVFGLDELKLRAVLLFTYFEAYRSQSFEGALEEPLTIECGFDDEKVAVGISFSLRDPAHLKLEGLQERISKSQPSNAFEILLNMIYLNSDHSVLRVEMAKGRIEVISFLAVPGKIVSSEKLPLTVVEQTSDAPVETVKAKEYVQLGDLEYAELLKEEGHPRAKKKASFSTGEILSKRFSTSSDTESKKVTVTGNGEEAEDDVIRISGGNNSTANSKTVRIAGESSSDDSEDATTIVTKGAGGGFSVQAMLRKIWPLKRKTQTGDQETEVEQSYEPEAPVASAKKPPKPAGAAGVTSDSDENADAEEASEAKTPGTDEEGDDPEKMAQILSNNFASGSFSQFVDRTQEMARQLKRDSKDQAAQRWAEGMSQQIMAEKVRLGALSQKINQAIRQKEQDLRRREQKFAEDLRRKEEALHQKTIALSRAKDQIAQLTAQVERQKDSKATGGEESNFKQKYQLSQRMLTGLREENTKLTAKIEELKVQTVTTAKASDSSAQVELANLKSKQDQMMRQNMQLKSLNEQLMRRMSQSSAKAAEKPDRSAVEEMKKKYETASKLAEQQQKEMTQLKAKLDKLSKEEARWVTDLAKKEAELRKTKTELEHLQTKVSAEKKPETKPEKKAS